MDSTPRPLKLTDWQFFRPPCKKCGYYIDHYVSAVGWDSGPGDPTIEPYWSCENPDFEHHQVSI